MIVRYDKLFQVHIEHQYFANLHFTGHVISPTKESHSLFHKYGLIIKPMHDGFSIEFADFFEGSIRDRASVLKEIFSLQFHFQITDPSFYSYTGNLPVNLLKKHFWFSNFDEKQQIWRTSDLLHMSEFVSESEIKQSPDLLNYFGYIEIRFDVLLKEDLYIRFLNKSTHWRYIIINEDLQQFEKLAILDKANKKIFSGPEIIELPNGSKGIAFTSAEPIALTQINNESFQLVVNYDEITNHFEKKLISKLPAPSLFNNANISESFIYL